jgi:hypothetical protein
MVMYVNDYEFRYGGNGLILNNLANVPTVGNPIFDITKVTGMDMPDIKVSSKDHDGYDGGAVEAQWYGQRTIGLDGTIFCHKDDSLEYWLDRLKSNYAPTTWDSGVPQSGQFFYIKAPGTPEKFAIAYSLGVKYDWDNTRRFNSQAFRIMLQCAQPQWYALSGKVLGPVAVGVPLTYYNEGNYATAGLIKIKAPGGCVNPTVTLSSSGYLPGIPVTATVPAGYEVWIDLGQRQVLLMQGFNTTNWRNRVTDEGGWFRFRPGANQITLAVSSGTPTLNLEITDQWI